MIKIRAERFAKNYVYNITEKEKIYDLIDKEIKGTFKTKNPTKQHIKKYKGHGSGLGHGSIMRNLCISRRYYNTHNNEM